MSEKKRPTNPERVKRQNKFGVSNPYYVELERAVNRVERATTHHQALGIVEGTGEQEIRLAYQRSVTLLNPIYYKDNEAVPTAMRQRIHMACEKITRAFRALVNSEDKPDRRGTAARESVSAQPDRQSQAANRPAQSKPAEDDNRRRSLRLKLTIPARVTGYERSTGEWQEVSETIDVSRTGVMLRMRRRLRHRMIVRLALPLPFELRSYGGPEETYNIYAFVRRVEPPRRGVRVVALEFLGERPPAGYLEKPWATFRMKWAGAERRRRPREDRSEVVGVVYLNESMRSIKNEDAFTENVSASGMRIRVGGAPPEFDLVRIVDRGRKLEKLASLSDRYLGKDNLERLCLRFISSESFTEKAATPAVEKPMPSDPARRKRILVADDDPPLRKVLSMILSDAGYEVSLAEDGRDAVERAQAEKPDLVIVDGLMPKLHGFLACQEIKQLPAPPKVLVLTAVYTKLSYKWEAQRQYGADDLMTKPFELSELLSCIKKHLCEYQ